MGADFLKGKKPGLDSRSFNASRYPGEGFGGLGRQLVFDFLSEFVFAPFFAVAGGDRGLFRVRRGSILDWRKCLEYRVEPLGWRVDPRQVALEGNVTPDQGRGVDIRFRGAVGNAEFRAPNRPRKCSAR